MLIDRIFTDDGKTFRKLSPGKVRKSYFSGAGAFGTGLWGNRGIIPAGGNTSFGGRNEYINISTPGDSVFFGGYSSVALTAGWNYGGTTSDGLRGIHGGGHVGGPSIDVLEHFSIPTPSDATDFGNLTLARQYISATTNGSRGIWWQGAVVDYITFATPGNATDWGDPLVQSNTGGAVTDGDRAVVCMSRDVEYKSITVSAGTSTDFGNMSGVYNGAGATNGSRGVFIGGHDGSAYVNTMEYITMSTPAAGVNFGDDTVSGDNKGATSDGSRGIRCSGHADNNRMSCFGIDLVGFNAVNFGSLAQGRGLIRSATSGG